MAQRGVVLGLRAAKELSRSFPAWFRADSGTNLFKQMENCHKPAVWSESSMVRVLARSSKGPGLESLSGVFFLLCDKM